MRLAINVIEDITELKRAEQGQRFLAEAGRVLAGSLDYEETLAAVARLAVPDIADWCAVDAIVDGQFKRLATAHADPRKVVEVLEIAERYPPDPASPSGAYGVMRSGRSEVYPEISDELLVSAAQDEEHLALLRSIGMTSAMVVPMIARGSVVGVVSFVSAETGHRFDDADLALAESLASRAATAVENARLYAARSAIARSLQASLLPPTLPDVPGFELAAVYHSASEGTEVGGDFYDVFNTAEDQWYAVVGDVCGKGAEAAAVTAMARYTIRAAAVRQALARGDPAAARRGDAAAGVTRARRAASARSPACTWTSPAPRRARRSPAAGIRCRRSCAPTARSRSSARPGRCSAWSSGPSCTTAPATCTPATRSCSTRTGSPRPGRRSACGGRPSWPRCSAGPPAARRRRSWTTPCARRSGSRPRRATTSRSSRCARAADQPAERGLPVAVSSSPRSASSGLSRSRSSCSPEPATSPGCSSG